MESPHKTLMIGALNMSRRRRVLYRSEAFCLLMVLFHIVTLAKGEPCSMKRTENQAECDLSSRFVLDSVCSHTDFLCFPPKLRDLLSEEKNAESQVEEVSQVQSDEEGTNSSRQLDSGIFKFLGGGTISCFVSYQECYSELPYSCIRKNRANDVSPSDDKYQHLKPNGEDGTTKVKYSGGSSPHVEIDPPLLNWGEKYLYFPSLAFLTVKNVHKDSTLTVFEPYGTDSQFYPCNFSETTLAPGETVSICFVFLPTRLGLSSAQFILQTSSGGFLVSAKGFVVESPYRVELDMSSDGRPSQNLSLYNPYHEALYVEEVAIWTSISSEDSNTHYAKAICNLNRGEDSDTTVGLFGVKEWLDVNPLISIRPHRNWEIDPHKTETIIELDFPSRTGGEIFGAFCLQLLSDSIIDTVVVPLIVKPSKTSSSTQHRYPLSLSIQSVGPCGVDGAIVVTLSVRNDSPYILSIVKISVAGENTEQIRISYVEGLLLFPTTVTQVAVITYTPSVCMNGKLLVSTNDSRNSEIEIACGDVAGLYSGGKFDSSIRHTEHNNKLELGKTRSKSSISSVLSPLEIKAVDTTEADELVLKNWKSQATAHDMSILDKSELVFQVIQIGSHHSQWITVKNPSPKPILVQFVLNCWEIIEECRNSPSHMQPSLSSRIVGNDSIAPRRYGFSLGENAVTEALLHPFSRASFGPVLFQPAARCQWRSSALVRNNLSGVEWLTLRGSGGLLSLVLLDKSEPVRNLDFKLNMPTPLNLSSSGGVLCSLPLSIELHAKNVGDFPLEVKKIEISGTECGTDGFVINGCEGGFSLEPEESIKLVVSYHTDFSVPTIQRDLELVLATGILVIPMKASFPICVLHFCKRSLFWTRVKKLLVTILLLASLFFLVLWCIVPHVVALGSSTEKGFITSLSHPSEKQSGKFVFSSKLNGLVRSIGEGEALLLERFTTYEDKKGTEVLSSTKSVAIQSSDTNETSKPGDLSVKTGKEKGRRRKKKKNSATALAGGIFEVSSSHSGNSTPSSPLSPVSGSAPRRPCSQPTSAGKKRTPSEFTETTPTPTPTPTSTYVCNSARFSPQPKPAEPERLASKPLGLPHQLVPASSSVIAPHLRAPGSKLRNEIAVKKPEEKIGMGMAEKFTYDIWGDHLSNLPLVGRSKENSSNSLFLMGPQTLITNYQQVTVRYDREG